MSVIHQVQPPSYQEAHILTQVHIAPAPAPIPDPQSDNAAPALITVSQASEVDPSVEEQKQVIYRHPLFPLMAMVFEKCEMASTSLDPYAGTDYDKDIQSFFEQSNKSFHSDDDDLDHLMLKSIQVLRIHLLELEKVSDLCKDFCSRYITCLKGKLQSEHLLRLDDMDSPPLSPTSSTTLTDWTGNGTVGALPSTPVMTPMGGGVVMQQGVAMATISQGQIISGNMVYQMVHTPQGIVAQPIQLQASPLQSAVGTTPVIQGSTPLSQIGMIASPVPSQPSTPVTSSLSLSIDEGYDDDDPLGKKRNMSNNTKRGVLPKQATQIMKSWLFQHLVHPYPTEDEKRQIASQTNLTLLQVNNWFINARRRILQPMLDGGGGGSVESKVKKNKPVTRPQQRFWPSAIANITPQIPPHLIKLQNSSPSSSSPSHTPPTLVNAVVTAGGQVTGLHQNLLLSSPSPPPAHTPNPLALTTSANSQQFAPNTLVISLGPEHSTQSE